MTRAEPGWVNAHTHLYSGLAPLGMPEPSARPANFLEILERVWWPLDRALDRASLRAAARLYAAEALLFGTTTLVDHHESPEMIEGSLDVIAEACEEIGIRAILCYGATERNGGRDEARRGLAECERFIRANRRPTIHGMVGLHASFTVSDATIEEAGALARTLGVPVHVHVAEDRADAEDARRRGWPGPLERLLALGGLTPGSILAHGVHLTPAEVAEAGRRGLWLVHNPRSNEGNRVGYARALGTSPRVALGTDGWPADRAAETAAMLRLAAAHAPEIPADVLLERAAAGRAIAAARFGDDAIALDGVERFEGADGRGPGPVREVTVAGARVVDCGRLVTADLDAIRAEAGTEAARLWARLAARRATAAGA